MWLHYSNDYSHWFSLETLIFDFIFIFIYYIWPTHNKAHQLFILPLSYKSIKTLHFVVKVDHANSTVKGTPPPPPPPILWAFYPKRLAGWGGVNLQGFELFGTFMSKSWCRPWCLICVIVPTLATTPTIIDDKLYDCNK